MNKLFEDYIDNNLKIYNLVSFTVLPLFITIQFGLSWFSNNIAKLIFFYIFILFLNLFDFKIHLKKLFYFSSLSLIINFNSFLKLLNDAHGFRQNQNALSVRYMVENGISIFNPLPVFGINSLVPFEFPFLQILSSILQNMYLSELLSLRPVAWLVYILFIYFAFLTINNLENKVFADIFVIYMVFHPLLYKYSNSYMIEFTPHLFGILSIYLLLKGRNVYSIIFLSFCLIAKVTSGGLYLIYWFLLKIFFLDDNYKSSFINLSYALMPALLWNLYIDLIKNSNELTVWLTSSNLRSWNFGTLSQYTDINVYRKILAFISTLILSSDFKYLGLLLIFVILIIRKESIFVFGLPFIFINLYYVHDYYFLAVVPFLIYFLIKSTNSFLKKNYQVLILLALLLIINMGMNINSDYEYRIAYKELNNLEKSNLANKLETIQYKNVYISSPQQDWNSTLFYESNKNGLMWLKRYEELGNTYMDPIKLVENNLQIFIFEEDNLNSDHFKTYLEYIFNQHPLLVLDFVEDIYSDDARNGQEFNYVLVYPEGINSNNIFITKMNNNYSQNNCIYDLSISENLKDEIILFFSNNLDYTLSCNF